MNFNVLLEQQAISDGLLQYEWGNEQGWGCTKTYSYVGTLVVKYNANIVIVCLDIVRMYVDW